MFLDKLHYRIFDLFLPFLSGYNRFEMLICDVAEGFGFQFKHMVGKINNGFMIGPNDLRIIGKNLIPIGPNKTIMFGIAPAQEIPCIEGGMSELMEVKWEFAVHILYTLFIIYELKPKQYHWLL